MNQELLADFELDVQQMKYLVDSIAKEDTSVLRTLLKRNILQMKGRLDQMLAEIESIPQNEPKGIISQESLGVNLGSSLPEVTDKVEFIPEISIEETLPDKNSVVNVFGESIWKSTDLRHSISLNDSFRFTREIFGGDSEMMNRMIEQISAMGTLDAALAFLDSKIKLNEENEAINDFLELLKKYFKSA